MCRSIGWAAVIFGVVACSEQPTEIAPPIGDRAQLNQPGDPGRVADLRQKGEGCAFAAADSNGVLRAIAVARAQLPFSLPPIRRDPRTGIGNGRVAGMSVRRSDSPDITVTCWVPETLTLEQLSAAVMASKTDARWDAIIVALPDAAELPDTAQRKMSVEARAFTAEMLGSPLMQGPGSRPVPRHGHPSIKGPLSTTPSHANALKSGPGIANLYEEGFGCGSAYYWFVGNYGYEPSGISCWYNGGNWSIEISMYFYYYDYWWDWYGWLLGNGYTPVQSCGDQTLDDIIASYYNSYYFSGSLRPACNQFDKITRTVEFSHADLSKGNGTDWAMLSIGLTNGAAAHYGADYWVQMYRQYPESGLPNPVTGSGYRTPKHNRDPSVGGAPGSRHMYGDALDLANNALSSVVWQALFISAQNANADYIEPPCWDNPSGQFCTGLDHVHADWRNH